MQLKCHRSVINIHDPKSGAPKAVRLKIKAMTIEEQTKFGRDYYKSANPESNALVARKDTNDEQEKKLLDAGTKNEREEFVFSDAEIKNRRLQEMTAEERAKYDAMDAAEEAFSDEFIKHTLASYVRVESGQDLEFADDFENDDAEVKPIRNGLELANAYGGERIIRDLLRIVHVENTQEPPAKKVLRPLFGFVPFSEEHEKEQVGQKPGQTADPVNEPVSAVTVVAEPITTVPLSGSEATD
jgi:hypothetical protein